MRALWAFALAWAAVPASAAPVTRVVLVSIDTLRADMAGTPSLSALAKDGAVFERAYAAATWTLPSHASLLSSRRPAQHGGGGTANTPSTWRAWSAPATLAGTLAAAGWKTKALVSSPVLDARWGFAAGFGEYGDADWKPGGGEPTLAAAADYLKKQKGPLFLFVHSNIVHSYIRLKPGAKAGCPLTGEHFLPEFASMPVAESPRSPFCRDARAAYERAAGCMDLALGPLLDAAKDALVVVTSDHGEILCEPHRSAPLRGHGFPAYDEQLAVPLLLRFPGGEHAGARVTAPARGVDVAATILDAAGVAAPPSFTGRSLLPLLSGAQSGPAPVTAEGDDWSALREPSRKYIEFADGRRELYDLGKDPAEREDLSRSRQGEAKRLSSALKAAAPRAKPSAGDSPLDPKLRESLRRAGYVE